MAKKLENGDGEGCGKGKKDHRGKGERIIREQEKGSREAMDVIQKFSVQPFVYHVIVLSKMCSCICPATAHAPEAPKP